MSTLESVDPPDDTPEVSAKPRADEETESKASDTTWLSFSEERSDATLTIYLPKQKHALGEVIHGKVVLESKKSVTLRAVRVNLTGVEAVQWREVSERRRKGKICKQSRKLVNKSVTLFGSVIRGPVAKKDTVRLEAGRHTWPFELPLPSLLPVTYPRDDTGEVKYELRAYVDMPVLINLTVPVFLHIYDPTINEMQLSQPVKYSSELSLSRCCFPQGHIAIDLWVPQRAVIEDDTLKCSVHIRNASSRQLENIQVYLISRRHYSAFKSNKEESTIYGSFSVRPGYVFPETPDFKEDVKLSLRELEMRFPSYRSRLISRDYFVVLKMQEPEFSCEAPIILDREEILRSEDDDDEEEEVSTIDSAAASMTSAHTPLLGRSPRMGGVGRNSGSRSYKTFQ